MNRAFFLLIALAFAPPELRAQSPSPPEVVGIRVGLSGCYKVGLWTEVEVTIRGGSQADAAEVSLIVPDGDGVPSRVSTPPGAPARLQPGRNTAVRLLARFGRVHGPLAVELRSGGNLIARRTFTTQAATSQASLDADHFPAGLEFHNLIVTVGTSDLGVAEIGKLLGMEAEHRPVAARVDDVNGLPTHWCGYEGVDAVVLSTSRPGLYKTLTGDSPQMQALEQWIRIGGRLILSVGGEATEVLADGPLAQFAPGRLEKMVVLRQTGALEAYCGNRTRTPLTGGGKTLLRAPRLLDPKGTIEVEEADLPLVIRTARGFGQILFLAVNLDAPPLADWPDRPQLVARLLDRPIGRGDESDAGTAMMHFGYSDLSGQLRSALERFEGVQLAPFWLVAGLIVAYLLLIGPGDYFLLRKLAPRMQWTWVTFPLLVALTCLGAYFLAYRVKGDQLKLHQADVVDIDTASGLIRGTTWIDVFSPAIESFNLAIEPQPPASLGLQNVRSWIAWLGLPGGALGGMNPRGGEPTLWTAPYDFSPSLDALRGMPIPVWSTKSLTAQWSATATTFPEADLTDDNQLLAGAVVNTLDFPLEQCILAYGRSVYELGRIAPGEAVRVGPMTKRSELRTLLTGRKVVVTAGDKYQQEATPYDQSSTDVAYILRTMMFYEAAGGRRYTGLWNDYQDFIDFSTLLRTDRAILIAQPSRTSAQAPAAALLRDGRPLDGAQDQSFTFYRFLFPVKKRIE